MYIKGQLIRGIANDALQMDLLSKAGVLKSLKQNFCHTEAFKSALDYQTVMTGTSDVATVLMLTLQTEEQYFTHQ